eukprot:TRINITY_DN17746_c0_g1_i1.p1 TRINITY_DN17746_c0_g1~~TRINITY_DN17746_c0_g1_i1.p1  ORF type:complete len:566 (+),score=111.38 TRINITY_DN17746_c0_g1_i1:95-1699(+)
MRYATVPEGSPRGGTAVAGYGAGERGSLELAVLRRWGGKATMPSSIINLVNTIIGAGMLSIPKAFKNVGLSVGVTLLCLCAAAAAFGLNLLAECARRTGEEKTSYNVVASRNVGLAATVAVDVAVALKCFGVSVAYLVVVGDLMPDAMDGFGVHDYPFNHRRFWISCAMAVVVPLALLRRIDSLRFTSAISVCTAFYLMAVLIYYCVNRSDNDGAGDVRLTNKFNTDFLSALPVMVFAFTCHQNIFTIRSELADNTERRVSGVIYASVMTTIVVYAAIGICGYLTYLDSSDSNVINNLPNDRVSVNIGRVVMCMNVMLSFALQSHPCRECVCNLCLVALCVDPNPEHEHIVAPEDTAPLALPAGDAPFAAPEAVLKIDSPRRFRKAGAPDSDSCRTRLAEAIRRRNRLWMCAVSLVLCALAFLVAWVLDDLGTVFGIVGGTGSTILCYILPGGLYLRSEQLLAERDGLPRPWDAKRIFAAVLFVVGIIMLGVANYSTIDKGSDNNTDDEPTHDIIGNVTGYLRHGLPVNLLLSF